MIDPLDFARGLPGDDTSAVALADRAYHAVLRARIAEALEEHGHDGPRAAEACGLAREVLLRMAKRYGLTVVARAAGRPRKG